MELSCVYDSKTERLTHESRPGLLLYQKVRMSSLL